MEFKTIDEICDIFDNLRKPITGKNREKGSFPYYGANGVQDRISSYIFDGTYLLVGEDGTVLTKDNKPVLHFVNGKFWVNNHAHVLKEKENVSLRYVYYALSTIDIKHLVAGLPPKLNQKNLKSIEIPLPPLETQKDIANKLDRYTKVNEELIENLKKEYELRRKQYDYYRDKLLTFGDEVKWVEIGDLLEYIQPNKYIVKDVNYSDTYNIPVLTAGQTFILGYTNEMDNIYKASKENPVIIFDDFTASFHWVDFDFKVKSSAMKMIVPRKDRDINFRYIYHFMKKLGYSSDAHSRLWISVYSKFKIPILSIEKQREIVDILDKFDILCNSLTEGLPYEIKLRQKQYEYYRDKLLTFE